MTKTELRAGRKSTRLPPDVSRRVIRDYNQLGKVYDLIVRDRGLNVSFLVGPRGQGKSHLFDSVLADYQARGEEHNCPFAYLNNAASAVGLFEWAFDNRDRLLVLDDIRQLFKDEGAITLLMALGDTKCPKRANWAKQNLQLQAKGIPNSFTTHSRICIITNNIAGVVEHLEPILDRGFIFETDISTLVLHQKAGEVFDDMEIHEFIGEHLNLLPWASFRHYTKAHELKRLGEDWREWLMCDWLGVDPKLELFAEVQRTPAASEAQRVERFCELAKVRSVSGSRATYFRIKADYPNLSKLAVTADAASVIL